MTKKRKSKPATETVKPRAPRVQFPPVEEEQESAGDDQPTEKSAEPAAPGEALAATEQSAEGETDGNQAEPEGGSKRAKGLYTTRHSHDSASTNSTSRHFKNISKYFEVLF